MGGGRKNLKRAVEEKSVTLQKGKSIMQVVSLRGSNIIEVIDAKGEKSLALFPAKFQKSMWVKRGSFVMVDESGRDEALKSGSKVACIVSQVLFYEQVRQLKKTQQWPEAFKSPTSPESSTRNTQEEPTTSQPEEVDEDSSSDDGLPPLETNTNRLRPFEPPSDSESDSCSE